MSLPRKLFRHFILQVHMPSRKTIFIRPHMIKLRMKLKSFSQLVKMKTNIYKWLLAIRLTDHWKPLASTGQKQSAPAFIGDLAFRYNAVKDLFAVSSSKAWSKDKNDKNLSEQESRSSYCSLRGVKKAWWRTLYSPPRTLLLSGWIAIQPVCRTFTCRIWRSKRQYQPWFLSYRTAIWCLWIVLAKAKKDTKSRIFQPNRLIEERRFKWYQWG